MRSPVEFSLSQLDSLSNLNAKIQLLLSGKPLKFEFEFYEIVDHFSNQNGSEDWLIKFPDITSSEPVLYGDTIFILSCYKNNKEKKFTIADPCWKDIFNAINGIAEEHNGLIFKNLEIIDLTEDGMSYVVEVSVEYKLNK